MTAPSEDLTAADQCAAATMRLIALADAIEAQRQYQATDRSAPHVAIVPPFVAAATTPTVGDDDGADAEPASFVDSAERVLRAIVSNVAIAAVAASVVLLLWAAALRVLPSAERPAFGSDPATTTMSSSVVTPP